MFWSLYLNSIILLLISTCMMSPLPSAADTIISGNNTDQQALLAFKSGITNDPLQVLNSWNDTVQFCKWNGVLCDAQLQRVVALDLPYQKLHGSLSPYIANLTFLQNFSLSDNSLYGKLPDVGSLRRLRILDLSNNSFQGVIPANLSNCRELVILRLAGNNLTGGIPSELGTLSKLHVLGLSSNQLTGNIPPAFGNFSSILRIGLFSNDLGGSIPEELGRASSLGFINFYGNRLYGEIPSSIYNLSSLYYLALADNKLHGSLPHDIGLTLPNLQVLGGGLNNFTGPIPNSLSNATGLQTLDFADNYMNGPIPVGFGRLQNISWLNFGNNTLETDKVEGMRFFDSLTNITALQVLGLDSNMFSGVLPFSVANLSSQLSMLLLGTNQLFGDIPPGIENYANLTFLSLENNFFTGSVPSSLGKLSQLRKLYLHGNIFSGPIPSSLGNLTNLSELFLQDNRLEGSIPPSLGNLRSLQAMNLSNNSLTGTIPVSVMKLPSITMSLSLANNLLAGSLPSEVGNLQSLGNLDVSENSLSGELPSALGNCLSLEVLRLEGNLFNGVIPSSLGALSAIQYLDLSRNNLSGQIPISLEKLSSLQKLNLSFNDLEGEVPTKGAFINASAISIVGNTKLCGGIAILELPACVIEAPMQWDFTSILIVVSVIIGILCLTVLTVLYITHYMKRKRGREIISPNPSLQPGQVSYAELYRATDEFSPTNLIGMGSFGSVYKGKNVCGEALVAVKVLNLRRHGAIRSFIDECEVLRNIRHRNLVKMVTLCSSVDSNGDDFKALVFEFMSGGSLEKWLHPEGNEQKLNFSQRLSIATDVAFALDYLHNQYGTTIVHCDLKPSNVLLDSDMTAHLGDFGLSIFLLDKPFLNFPNSMGLKGTIGYVPPEYGYGSHVSELGDVFSYGIFLLELFTGKSPTDGIFKDGLTLRGFAMDAFPDRVMEIMDPTLLSLDQDMIDDDNKNRSKSGREHDPTLLFLDRERIDDDNRSGSISDKEHECLVSMIKIALACSNESPKERMVMGDVSFVMQRIRDVYLGTGVNGERIVREK